MIIQFQVSPSLLCDPFTADTMLVVYPVGLCTFTMHTASIYIPKVDQTICPSNLTLVTLISMGVIQDGSPIIKRSIDIAHDIIDQHL